MAVVLDARRAKSALLGEVLEEPPRTSLERRASPPRATSPAEVGKDESQHLLDRIAYRARDLLPRCRLGALGALPPHPPVHERVDVGRQLLEVRCSPLPSEVSEMDQDRDAAEHDARGVAVVG